MGSVWQTCFSCIEHQIPVVTDTVLTVQLLQALARHEQDLSEVPKTVDSKEEAWMQLQVGLNHVASETKAACGPNRSGITNKLRDIPEMKFGPRFKAVAKRFISQVSLTSCAAMVSSVSALCIQL